MSKLDIDSRLRAFSLLSEFMQAVANNQIELVPKGLEEHYYKFQDLIPKLYNYNGWFTEEFVRYQLGAIAQASVMDNLNKWLRDYRSIFEKTVFEKRVAVIMAGNIPFVGFSDYISVLVAGFCLVAKLSSKDTFLPKAITEVLLTIEPAFEECIVLTEEKVSSNDFDLIIATGSDNTARYFEYYFGKYPNIIRRNRTSVAVLTGEETDQELAGLADDIFLYFGLGCRNVSKIYLPKGYEINRLFKAFYRYKHLINYNKYANNYEYNRAIMLVNKEQFYDNGFVLMKEEDIALVSPTAVIYYQYYSDIKFVVSYLKAYIDKIQCVVSNFGIEGFQTVPIGNSQRPMLWDWPDGVNVLEFLAKYV